MDIVLPSPPQATTTSRRSVWIGRVLTGIIVSFLLVDSSLDGNVRRAIDIHEGEKIDGPALKALIRAAAALNASGKTKKKKAAPAKRAGR